MNNAINLIVSQQKTSFHISTDTMNSQIDGNCNVPWLTECLDTADKTYYLYGAFDDCMFLSCHVRVSDDRAVF